MRLLSLLLPLLLPLPTVSYEESYMDPHKRVSDLTLKLKEDFERITWVSDQLHSQISDQKNKGSNKGNALKLEYLNEDITQIQADMTALLLSLNETETALVMEQEKMVVIEDEIEMQKVEDEAAKVIADIREGKVKVDYETGVVIKNADAKGSKDEADEVQAILIAADPKSQKKKEGDKGKPKHEMEDHHEPNPDVDFTFPDIRDYEPDPTPPPSALEAAKLLAAALDSNKDGPNSPEGGGKDAANVVPAGGSKKDTKEDKKQQMAEGLASKIKEEIGILKETSDPAVMQVDVVLLLDIVTLAITASFCGMLATWARLPAVAGFLIGGMMIGPSWWDVVDRIKEVQTLAQFGSVFILFEQGLLYSQQYIQHEQLLFTAKQATPTRADRSSSDQLKLHQKDVRTVGLVLFAVMAIIASVALSLLGCITKGYVELIIVSSSLALTSSTVVNESLHAAHLKESVWGSSLLKVVAMQDVIMIPLLSLPEIYHSNWGGEEGGGEGEGAEEEAVWKGVVMHGLLLAMYVVLGFWLSKHWIAVALRTDKLKLGSEGEIFTLSVVAYALMMATFTEENQVSLEAGALFAGIALMKSPHVNKVLESIRPITSVFGGMYVTAMGMIISPAFVANRFFSIVLLTVVVGGIKMAVATYILKESFGYEVNVSMALSSSMAQISEGSLVVLAKAQRLGFVSRQTYLILIPTTCLLLCLASPLTHYFMGGLTRGGERERERKEEGGGKGAAEGGVERQLFGSGLFPRIRAKDSNSSETEVV